MTPKDINDGELYGVLGGYGAMNQASLVSMMSLLLAQKCGVNNDAIEQAIRRGHIFFSHYINKGAIPYGDHGPRVNRYDDNGKTASAAVEALLDKAVHEDDVTMQLYAIDALVSPGEKGLATAAKSAVPSLLKLAVRRSPDDPRRLVAAKLAGALCYPGGAARYRGLLHLHGMEDVDRSLLIPAIRAMLTADDGHARSFVASLYGKLKPTDLETLWGDIYFATRDRAPSGVMFADGVRGRGVELLQEHGFKEGVDIAAKMLAEDRWGRHAREWQVLPVVKAYGGSAKPVIPVLEELIEQEEAQHARVQGRRERRVESTTETSERAERLKDIIRHIQAGEEQDLRSIMPYVKK